MASTTYPKFKQSMINGDSNVSLAGSGSTGVWAALIDTGTTAYSSVHQFYSDISSAIIGTPVELATGKTYTGGLFDADDVTFTSVSGASVEAIILYVKNVGANTTWRLFSFIDQATSGLPVTPNGGNITITWNASGIVQL